MLLPVSSYERQPLGLFPLMNGISVEGGLVGEIVAGVGRQAGTPVVTLYDDGGADGYGSATSTSLVGLIDDSTTGSKNSGFGNIGQVGKLLDGTHVGPSTTYGSGKATIWVEAGLFITDQFAADITSSIVTGTALYATSAGKLTTVVGTNRIGTALKVYTGGLNNVAVQELLGVIPRVQPLPANTTLLLFKFK